ncbi:MAG: hypothetical protein AAF539_04920 [Planctomycetota bacterium]
MSKLAVVAVLMVGFLLGVVWASGLPSLSADDGPESVRIDVIQSRPGRDAAGSGDLIGFSHQNDSGTQVISLIHTRKLWLAVYHVDSSGAIKLISSREIGPDFTLHFNEQDPLPAEIRQLSE